MKPKCGCGACPRCKKRAYDRARYLANREAKLAQNRAYAEANRDAVREYYARYREENREALLAEKRAWYYATQDVRKVKAREYYRENREDMLAKMRARYAQDPGHALAINRASAQRHPEARRRAKRRYKDRLRGAPLTAAAEEMRPILLADPCSYCGGLGGEIDHIEPVVSGGSGDWDNLTSACRSCNARKQGRPLLLYLAAYQNPTLQEAA